MSKRFPIPDFDRDQYKNLAWLKPQGLSSSDTLKASNEAASGPINVAISSQLAAKYKFEVLKIRLFSDVVHSISRQLEIFVC